LPLLFGRISVATEDRMYYLCLAGLLLCVGIVRGVRNSRTGRVLIAVRENPRAAQAFGVSATSAKLTAFALSGFIAALAGGIFIHHQRQLGISAYTVAESREAFSMIVIGGLGSIPGAFLGAFLIKGLGYFSSVFPSVVRPYLNFFTTGVGLLIVLLIVPGGFSQIFYNIRDRLLRVVADRRGIVVPSLVADMRVTTSALGPAADTPSLLNPEDSTLDIVDALGTAAGELGELEAALHAKLEEGEGRDDGQGAVATLPRRTRARKEAE
jgi:branched-chain amino acid transport system permease protein